MIRLLHLADVHLGRPFQMLGEKGASKRRALEAALVRAVDAAIERRVHLVLVAGDLFDSPKPSPANSLTSTETASAVASMPSPAPTLSVT